MSLPEEYGGFSSTWESAGKADRTLDILRARLVIEGERNMSKSKGVTESCQALYQPRISRKQTRRMYSCARAKEAGKEQKNKMGKCFKCGKFGHWKNDCRR